MIVGLAQSAVMLATALAYYIVDFALIARFDRQRQAEGSGRSWSYTTGMLLAAGFVAAQPVLLPGLGYSTPARWGLALQAAGVLMLASGLGLHAWARAHLRHYYAERVELQPGHQVVDTGPYRLVRHPVFTSFFLTVTGLVLVNPAVPTALIALYTYWDFSRAARQEEELLSRSLPGYSAYVARTGRFFPLARRSAPQASERPAKTE